MSPLLLAVWFGLGTGLAEVLVLGLRKLGFHHVLHLGLDVAWMAPLGDALLFLPIGVAGSLLVRGWPGRDWQRASVPVLCFLSAFAVSLVVPWLNEGAGALFSAGVAVQSYRSSWHRGNRLRRLARSTTPALAATVLLSGVGVQAWRVFRERWEASHLPAPAVDAPNVLLLVLDTVRALSLSLYGFERPTTPELERLAREGTVFERAFAAAPWTLPSHASMFTGRPAHQLNATWLVPFESRDSTIAEVLAAHGYLTAGLVANQFYGAPEFGLARGFQHYRVYPQTLQELALNCSLGRQVVNSWNLRRLLGYFDIVNRKRAAEVNRELLSWLSGRPVKRPFFAFLNYFDAHEPYLPPPPYASLFRSPGSVRIHTDMSFSLREAILETWNRVTLPPPALRGEADGYEGSIAYLDHEVGALLDSLRARGLLEHTLIVVTADHGEAMGEHHRFLHGEDLFNPALHVPLLILFPGEVPAGRRVAEAVTLQDLPVTLLDLLRLREPGFPGVSLTRFWRDPNTPSPRTPVLSSFRSYDGRSMSGSLIEGRYHFIRDGKRKEALYDFETDPLEGHDLSRTPEAQRILPGLRARLDSLLKPSPS